jgi:hypothetical protein
MAISTAPEHFDAARQWQEYYDTKLRTVGMRAPAPVLGETVGHYRRETLLKAKKAFLPQNHPFYKMNIRGLPYDVLNGFDNPRESDPKKNIIDAAIVEADNPAHVPDGELRRRERYADDGTKFVDWIGQTSFIRVPNFGCETPMHGGFRPGRRVVGFRTSDGYVNTTGTVLR